MMASFQGEREIRKILQKIYNHRLLVYDPGWEKPGLAEPAPIKDDMFAWKCSYFQPIISSTV